MPFPSCQKSLAGILVAGLLLGAAPLHAADVEVALGMSNTTDREFTPVGSVAWLPQLRPMSNAVLRADVGAVYVAGRGHVAGRDLGDSVVVAHLGLRYERSDNGLTLGAGVAAQSGETDALSGDVQFITTAGWRWERLSVLVRHISNASLNAPNNGETMLVGGWRF